MADEREQLHLEISETIVPGADLATYAKVCKIVDRVVAERDEARAERDRWFAQNVRLADERDEARRVVKQVNDNCADFAEAIGLSRDSYGDEIIATAQRLVAERDTYRANGKEAAKVAFGVSEKLATVEAELAETHAAHRAALLGVSRPGQPTYEALEEHVAGLVQENGVLRGEIADLETGRLQWAVEAIDADTKTDYVRWLHAEAVWQLKHERFRTTMLRAAVVRELHTLADLDGVTTADIETLADHIEAGDWLEGDPGLVAATPSDLQGAPRLGATADDVAMQTASCHVFECRNDRTADSPYCPAHTQITELLAAAPSPPVDRDGLIEIVATNQLRRYDEEFDASHLSWRDFESSAAEDVDALISAGVVAQPLAVLPSIALLAAERHHAIALGYGSGLDDLKTSGSLAEAAICYAANYGDVGVVDDRWPWAIQYWKPTGDRVRDLVKAGQFIAAEIDRLLRARDSSREAGQP